jgi:hypothetical protein
MLEQSIVNRLSFIKYLYKVAVEQSDRLEPLCAASILTLHDAAELFLQLATEHLNVKGKQEIKFMEYWDIIGKHPKVRLTQQESMRRLHKARNTLKHNGIFPPKLDIEAFRATATNFFEENTPNVFGVDFSDISLVNLIQYEDVRNSLKEAGEMLHTGNIEGSIHMVAIAFAQLIDNYDEDKGYFGRSLFFHDKMRFSSSISYSSLKNTRTRRPKDHYEVCSPGRFPKGGVRKFREFHTNP